MQLSKRTSDIGAVFGIHFEILKLTGGLCRWQQRTDWGDHYWRTHSSFGLLYYTNQSWRRTTCTWVGFRKFIRSSLGAEFCWIRRKNSALQGNYKGDQIYWFAYFRPFIKSWWNRLYLNTMHWRDGLFLLHMIIVTCKKETGLSTTHTEFKSDFKHLWTPGLESMRFSSSMNGNQLTALNKKNRLISFGQNRYLSGFWSYEPSYSPSREFEKAISVVSTKMLWSFAFCST